MGNIKLNLENTGTVEQQENGEWMCIWAGEDSKGRKVWCRMGPIYDIQVEPVPKGKPFGSKKRK